MDIKFNEMFQENSFKLFGKWLEIEDNTPFELLVMAASNNNHYEGTLRDICQWRGVASCSVNNNKIKEALDYLRDSGYLSYSLQGYTYIISLKDREEYENDYINIKYEWLKELRSYKKSAKKTVSITWAKILKVFMVCVMYINEELVNMDGMAKLLHMNVNSIRNAFKALGELDLVGIEIGKYTVIKKMLICQSVWYYKTLGTRIEKQINVFETDVVKK